MMISGVFGVGMLLRSLCVHIEHQVLSVVSFLSLLKDDSILQAAAAAARWLLRRLKH